MPSALPLTAAGSPTGKPPRPVAARMGMPEGLTPDNRMGWAMRDGRVEDVRAALADGANLDGPTRVNGYPTWLAWAVFRNQRDKVQVLIEAGAATRWPSGDGGTSTPLHIALDWSHHRLVTYLMQQTPVEVHTQDRDGDTVLHLAAQAGYLPVVRRLEKAGADPLARNHDGQTPIDLARRMGHAVIVHHLEAPLLRAALGELPAGQVPAQRQAPRARL